MKRVVVVDHTVFDYLRLLSTIAWASRFTADSKSLVKTLANVTASGSFSPMNLRHAARVPAEFKLFSTVARATSITRFLSDSLAVFSM